MSGPGGKPHSQNTRSAEILPETIAGTVVTSTSEAFIFCCGELVVEVSPVKRLQRVRRTSATSARMLELQLCPNDTHVVEPRRSSAGMGLPAYRLERPTLGGFLS